MAKEVVGRVLGGETKVYNNVDTVEDVKQKLKLTGEYTAAINGEPADLEDDLEDFDQVLFSPAVKGGM